jgi:hypothetical protein
LIPQEAVPRIDHVLGKSHDHPRRVDALR